MIKLYGITNCDSVKKAKKWLTEAGIEFDFVDFRKQGLSSQQVTDWVENQGVDLVLNRRGTTWRTLPEEQKAIEDVSRLIELMVQNPTLIKRPVLETGKTIHVGFKAEQYESLFR